MEEVGPTLEKGSIGLGQEHIHSDQATLYSSTSSTKATLYSVKDNGFEALYDTVSPNAVNYYGSAKSDNIDTQYKVTNSPAICFYGSRKHQETGPHSDKTSPTGPHAKSSVISTSFDSGATTEHQPNTTISPKPDIYSTRNSDWSEISQQDSNPNSSSHQSGCSAGSHSPQRFSHKQALLRRAFQEMLKSDPNDSPTDQAKEKRSITTHDSPTKTEMNKADGSKSEERETTYFTSSQSTSEKTSPADTKSLQSISPEEKPSLPSYESSSETPEGYRLSDSFGSVAAPITSEDQSNSDLVCTRSKVFMSSSMSEDAERAMCKLDASNKTMESEKYPNTKENQNVNDDKNEKDTEKSKDLQSNVIDRIVSTSADVDMKVLQDEICNKVDEKNKEDAEVQPSMLLSVLYKELMKTRQEVEKLRKVQELMLTEKEEKKEDTAEHDSENKIKCEKIDENLHSSKRILEKRKDHEICDDAELKIDYDEGLFHESKRSKISIRSDLLPTETNTATSSDTLASQKSISYTHESSSPTVTDPSMAEAKMEISVITLEGSIVLNTSHPSLISPGIPASPGLSSSISVPPRMISSLPTGHVRTSPGMASPGASRTSPGILKPWMPSPTSTRASPGTPKSNSGGSIASPGISISPAMSNSPGIPRNSPVAPPRSSPGVLRMSPGLMRVNYEMPRRSPGEPMISPGALKIGRGSMRNSSELPTINHGTPQMSPTLPQGNICNPPSTENLQISDSHSAVTTVLPKMTTVQSIISPVVPIPRYPQTPITSSPVPLISPKGGGTNCPVSRISPSTSKIDTPATVSLSMSDIALTNMSPSKLRSAFGISNSEVELMPVSAGAKQPLHEPQPQTFLKLVEDQHQTTETPLLLNAVHGVRQETVSQDVESTSHGSVPFHKLGCHEDPKRIMKTRQYGGEMKRHTFSTSDLPDHAPSTGKLPPPLKPVSALLRRHSDNRDLHSMMHHQAMYPGTHKNFGGPLHFSTSAAELKHSNPVHPLSQPQYNPAQYPLPSTDRRRNSENDTSETNREYQQAVAMGMQHQHSLIAPGSSVTRSLGPDKATIFPVPPTMPTAIRPFRPRTPPSVTRAHHEQFQNENFYRLNYSFFEKIRERFAHPCDNEFNAMDRLQPSTNNPDKFLHPQTFIPRVLVRESIPEVSSHIPTTTYTTSHFPNPNHQAPPNVMPSHQNPFSGNMHPGPSIHHMAQHRRHATPNQATSSIQHINSSRSGEKFCHHCPQQARYVCSGCKKVWYCSEQCQRDHWSIHNTVCVL